LAVWPCLPPVEPPGPGQDPHPAAAPWPPLLAQRLVAVYSRPGDTVVAAGTGAATITDQAARLDRRPVLDPASACTTQVAMDPGWRAHLIVLAPPAATIHPGRYRRWAAVLAPAGILVVLLRSGHQPGAAVRPGRVITAAAEAGLGYIQHIVAVTGRLSGDRIIPAATTRQLQRARAAYAAGQPIHLPVHADVLIFTHPSPATAGAAIPDPPSVHLAATREVNVDAA
jgi:hypothetical protein